VTLNAPTARCLQLLLESNGKLYPGGVSGYSVENRGIVVSQNTFYQNISLLRKSLLKAGLSQDIIVTVRQRGLFSPQDQISRHFSERMKKSQKSADNNEHIFASG
jgi:DNA-binding winged helix-turn-helix (wHTH) protein